MGDRLTLTSLIPPRVVEAFDTIGSHIDRLPIPDPDKKVLRAGLRILMLKCERAKQLHTVPDPTRE
jgi:hypothetical protein